MKKTLCFIPLAAMLFAACSTTQKLGVPNDFVAESTAPTLEEELQQNETDENNILIQEEIKIQDVENTVVYVDRPVYVPESKKSENDYKKLTGIDAVIDSQKRATQKPENYKSGTFFYQFNENFVFEIYAQPYHLTDIQLQPGEVVIGTPLLSEDESVWELTAGVAKEPGTNQDIQHLFVKPAYSKQDSSLIII
ncbi:TrbG/VirB9 family P-type conjugative transfer protein, partial [Treponema sp.]|uniref:TrbG/VirB9 family P-type conjugative transfer protein n=1 Tax=Treponema sp. TaxID=166 RepID=UPI00388FFC9B